jgi:hypothetical protein
MSGSLTPERRELFKQLLLNQSAPRDNCEQTVQQERRAQFTRLSYAQERLWFLHHIHECLGDGDTLFLGMECDGAPLTWLYGPLLLQPPERGMDESRRLNGSNYGQAMNILRLFNFREVYVFAMGQEPWLSYIMSLQYTPQSRPIVESNRLVEECRTRGITSEQLFGRKEGFYE